ncbi:DUF4112 domain-containing protein [Caulobacter sp.]|uniref:DUF4112 domain-containing protein n=1 Tax=Caulobacter sp. TaxID=78 RepID=UPI003BAD0751
MTIEAAPHVSAHGDSKRARAHRAWKSADTVKRLSDRLIGIGPFGLGLDGVLSWVPVVGPLYSMGAGGLLLMHGLQGGASPFTLLRMLTYVVMDTATDAVPIAGSMVDMIFPGHLMAAKALQKDIEARHGLPDDIAAAMSPKQRRKAAKRP